MIVLHLFMVQNAQESVIRSTLVSTFHDVHKDIFNEERATFGDTITFSRKQLIAARGNLPQSWSYAKWGVMSEDAVEVSMYSILLQQLKDLQRRFVQYAGVGKKEHKIRELIASEMKRLPWRRSYLRDEHDGRVVEERVESLHSGWKRIMEDVQSGNFPESLREVLLAAQKLSQTLILPTEEGRYADHLNNQLRARVAESYDVQQLWLLYDRARGAK